MPFALTSPFVGAREHLNMSTTSPQRTLLLLVDDDELIVDALGFVLADEFEILAAPNRASARELLRKTKPAPQLALIDLGLPPTPHTPSEGFALIGDLFAFNPTRLNQKGRPCSAP